MVWLAPRQWRQSGCNFLLLFAEKKDINIVSQLTHTLSFGTNIGTTNALHYNFGIIIQAITPPGNMLSVTIINECYNH